MVGGIFAALFLWMFLIANMIGIILTYLGVADADAFANEAQSAELSNMKVRIEAILKKEEYKQEILALIEQARDKGLLTGIVGIYPQGCRCSRHELHHTDRPCS